MPSDQFHRVEKLVGDCEDWHVIGVGDADFENSWDNAGASAAAYYKDPFGQVHIKGQIDTGSSGTTAFTLPELYRPDEPQWFSLVQATGVAGGFASVNVNGAVICYRSTTNLNLSGIDFRV